MTLEELLEAVRYEEDMRGVCAEERHEYTLTEAMPYPSTPEQMDLLLFTEGIAKSEGLINEQGIFAHVVMRGDIGFDFLKPVSWD